VVMFIRLSKMLMGKHALAGKAVVPGCPGKRAHILQMIP
jgi:hypothetical protein